MIPLYALAINAYFIGIRIAALFNHKADLWVKGRRAWRQQLAHFEPAEQTVWLHCASLGEFEQGRPLIEEIKATYPETKVVLTFFSPSGYEVRKNYPHADLVFYLPPDGPANARAFVNIIRPKLALFVKYEMWFFYLSELKAQNIPALLVSANFPAGHRFARGPQKGLFRKMLRCFQHIFAQNPGTVSNIQQIIGPDNITLSGDTRFDRVVAIAGSFSPITSVGWFTRQRFTVVAGSTWPADEKLLKEAFWAIEDNRLCLIIAPHQIQESHLAHIESLFEGRVVRFSDFVEPENDKRVLLIDNIGMLSRLYRYADLCYVGGGFGSGIHNTLEAAVWGQRVLFGPRHQRFQEAHDLISIGAGLCIQNAAELTHAIRDAMHNTKALEAAQEASKAYVENSTGATECIMEYIKKCSLLHHNTQTEELEELI